MANEGFSFETGWPAIPKGRHPAPTKASDADLVHVRLQAFGIGGDNEWSINSCQRISNNNFDGEMMNIDNPIGQLRQELARLDCLDTQHAIQIGKLAVSKGESPQRVAASIMRHWPNLFVARQD